MFVEFSVGNFRSFREPVTLSMLASKRKSLDPELDKGAIFQASSKINLLKNAIIFGPNASGKSNIFSAIRFLKDFVISSSKESQADEKIDVSPFKLSSEFINRPSNFSISFIIENELFQYSIEVNQTEVVTENLKSFNFETSRNTTLFERANGTVKPKEKFPEGIGLESKTRSNALFLSVCANFDGTISKKILKWFRQVRVINGLEDESMLRYTSKQLQIPEKKSKIMHVLSSFDLGIDDFMVEETSLAETMPRQIPPQLKSLFEEIKKVTESQKTIRYSLSSIHPLHNHEGEIIGKTFLNFEDDESEGTQKIVALAGPIVDALDNSLILFIDEFDARLHPHLSRNFVKIFNSSITNPNNAQLIIASHDTNLMNNKLIRRDQVWLIEKSTTQASKLHSLIEFKTRNNAVFQKEYDAGRFGAIPYISDSRLAFCQSAFSSNNIETNEDGK